MPAPLRQCQPFLLSLDGPVISNLASRSPPLPAFAFHQQAGPDSEMGSPAAAADGPGGPPFWSLCCGLLGSFGSSGSAASCPALHAPQAPDAAASSGPTRPLMGPAGGLATAASSVRRKPLAGPSRASDAGVGASANCGRNSSASCFDEDYGRSHDEMMARVSDDSRAGFRGPADSDGGLRSDDKMAVPEGVLAGGGTGEAYCNNAGAGAGEDDCVGLWVLAVGEPGNGGILSRLGLSLMTVYTIFVLAIGREVSKVAGRCKVGGHYGGSGMLVARCGLGVC